MVNVNDRMEYMMKSNKQMLITNNSMKLAMCHAVACCNLQQSLPSMV